MVGRVFLSTFPKASRVRLHRAQGRCLQSGPVTETGRERLNSQDVFEVETVILRTKKHQGAFGGGVNVCTQPKMGERALLLALLPHPPPGSSLPPACAPAAGRGREALLEVSGGGRQEVFPKPCGCPRTRTVPGWMSRRAGRGGVREAPGKARLEGNASLALLDAVL